MSKLSPAIGNGKIVIGIFYELIFLSFLIQWNFLRYVTTDDVDILNKFFLIIKDKIFSELDVNKETRDTEFELREIIRVLQ